MTRLPLVERPADAPIAYVGAQAITVGRFLAQASELAARLPAHRYAFNLCNDRYTFSVSFAAVLLAGQTNLLPANRLPATVAELREAYPDSFVLTDEDIDYGDPGQVNPHPLSGDKAPIETPTIPAEHVAAIAFTSGSTGGSKPIEKSWGTLLTGARINAGEMGVADRGLWHLVATVPPQHMYGLECSVLIPLVAPLAVSAARPFTPIDLAETLAQVPAPRCLVTTPVHLRAVIDAGESLPSIERVYSATAPLDPDLARQVEASYGTRLQEIFGCSEAGSLARREPVRETDWTLFADFSLDVEDDVATVHAAHLPERVPLQDRVERHGTRGLRLLGRAEDLVNIAGKRASLADLTQQLLRVPGVKDGVIFEPERAGASERLAALVVAPGMNGTTIRRALRKVVDAAFLPRPIRMIDALPRSETGKLTRAAVQRAYTDGVSAASPPEAPASRSA